MTLIIRASVLNRRLVRLCDEMLNRDILIRCPFLTATRGISDSKKVIIDRIIREYLI